MEFFLLFYLLILPLAVLKIITAQKANRRTSRGGTQEGKQHRHPDTPLISKLKDKPHYKMHDEGIFIQHENLLALV